MHSRCFACSAENERGLGLHFRRLAEDRVQAGTTFGEWCQGYNGCVHGGIIASALDSAMAKCLMGRGIPAMTAELKVRYVAPVPIHVPIVVTGWLKSTVTVIYDMAAEMTADGILVARATGRFAVPSEVADFTMNRYP